jgi:hypothetical protein
MYEPYFCLYIADEQYTRKSSRWILYLTIYGKTGHYDNVPIVIIVVNVVRTSTTKNYDKSYNKSYDKVRQL